jgi:hypothetical protein
LRKSSFQHWERVSIVTEGKLALPSLQLLPQGNLWCLITGVMVSSHSFS